jgi:hypothetical protein
VPYLWAFRFFARCGLEEKRGRASVDIVVGVLSCPLFDWASAEMSQTAYHD